MNKTIAIINQKGGVGKTTTCVNLADALTHYRKKVLIIDLDPQANATDHLGFNPEELPKNIFHVLVESTPPEEAVVKVKDRLFLIPSSMHMSRGEMILSGMNYRERVLKKAIQKLKPIYDYILLDCPPSLGTISLNALSAANEVLITLQAEYLAALGLTQLSKTIEEVRENINPDLTVCGILITMLNTQLGLSKEILADLPTLFPKTRVFDTRIHRNVALAEAAAQGKSIFDYQPKSRGALDYLALAKEMLHAEAKSALPAQEKAAVGRGGEGAGETGVSIVPASVPVAAPVSVVVTPPAAEPGAVADGAAVAPVSGTTPQSQGAPDSQGG